MARRLPIIVLLLAMLLPLAALDPADARQPEARLDLLIPELDGAESWLGDVLAHGRIAIDPALTAGFAASRELAREAERLADGSTAKAVRASALRTAVGDLERRISWSQDIAHLLYAKENEAARWRDHQAPPELQRYVAYIDDQVRMRMAALATMPREAGQVMLPDHHPQSRRHEQLLEVVEPLHAASWRWPLVPADAPVLARLRALVAMLTPRLERALQDGSDEGPSEQERELLRQLTQQAQFEQECAERLATGPAPSGEAATQVVRLIAAGGIANADDLMAFLRQPPADAQERKSLLAEVQRRGRRQHQLRMLVKRWLQGELEAVALAEALTAQAGELPSPLRASAQDRRDILARRGRAMRGTLAEALAGNDQFAVATALGELMAVHRAGQRLQEEWDWTLRLERHRQSLIAEKVDPVVTASHRRLQDAFAAFLAQRACLDDAEDAERRTQGSRFAAEEAKSAARLAREEFLRQLRRMESPEVGPSPAPEADPGF